MILESAGYEVVEAPHGAAALERAKESPPDLVVTDLMMPVMNGASSSGASAPIRKRLAFRFC